MTKQEEENDQIGSEYVPNLPLALHIFFTTGVQGENLTFLGVRSTNPLPAASGLDLTWTN